MTQQFTNNSSSDECVDARQHLSLELLVNALGAVTDGLFLFDSNRLLILANQQAESLQPHATRLRIGSQCCERFWQDGDPNTCVVDRALENGLKLEFGM